MKTGKKILTVLLTLIVAGAFFACGSPSDNDETKTPTVTYTVTYNPDGGALTGQTSVTVEKGKSVTLPTVVKDDFVFAGWFNGETLAGLSGAEYTPTANITLTAHWTVGAPDYAAYAATNKERAVAYAKKIKQLYWDSSTKLSKLTPQGGTPFLWPYTEQLSMVNGVLRILPKTDADYAFFSAYLEELIEGIRHYRVGEVNPGTGQSWNNADHVLAVFGENDGTANSYAIYNSGRRDDSIDAVNASMSGVYFDDNVWVAKEFYFAYLNLGDEKYLNEAINIVNWIVGEGYEPTEGLTGIYWKWSAKFVFGYNDKGGLSDDVHASLNACSSAPTAMMLANLYRVMTDADHREKFGTLAADYLLKAQNIYEFCYQTLRDPESGCLYDKIFLKENFATLPQSQRIELTDGQILPYNTGTLMTAGAELYNISVDTDKTAVANVYKKRNTAMAKDADVKFAGTQAVKGQYSYNSNSWFTSFILDGFIDISETGVDTEEYVEHMRSSLDYGYTNNRAEDGLVCPAWVIGWSEFNNTSPNSEQNPRQILLQSANAHCYAMLARYYAAK